MPSNRTLRDSALLDQFGAFCRDERKELLRMSAEMKRDEEWWTDPHTMHTLLKYLADQCSTVEEASRTIDFVYAKPQAYRAEYVVAVCKLRDTKTAAT